MVVDDAQREADQDRREGRQPRPLRRLPNGRSPHSTTLVLRHPADDRGTATAVSSVDGIERPRVRSSSQTTG